jgi:hypothetical protein
MKLIAAGLLLILGQQPEGSAVSGQWTLTFKAVFPIPATMCDFKTDGRKLTGECRDREGHPAIPIEEGTIAGAELRFAWRVKLSQDAVNTIRFIATTNDARTALTGTLSVDRGAEVGSFTGAKK